jgi:hypothetical protein
MSDLVTWLKAQLQAEERAARFATRGGDRWSYIAGPYGPQVNLGDGVLWAREDVNVQVWQCDDEADGCPEEARAMAAEGKHVALHDPTRVLAEVAAKRAILDRHDRAWANVRAHPEDMASKGADLTMVAVVKALAAPYADKPGYLEEWAP